MTSITLNSVDFTYPDKTNIFKKINIEFYENQISCIMGPSGSGKTTLFNLLSLFLKPTKGNIQIDSSIVNKLYFAEKNRFRREIYSLMTQNLLFFDYLTCWENIILHFQNLIENSNLINNLAKKLNVYDILSNFPNELSGGQKQRISFIRALIKKPKILLLDEPTSNLDYVSSMNLFEIIKEKKEESGMNIIIFTHDPLILKYSDSIYHIEGLNIIKA